MDHLVWDFCIAQGFISICSCTISCKETSNPLFLFAVLEHLPKFPWSHLFSFFEFLSHFRLEGAQTTFWPMHLFLFWDSSFLFFPKIWLCPLFNIFIDVSFWLFFRKAFSSVFSWLLSDVWSVLNYFLNKTKNFNFWFFAPYWIKIYIGGLYNSVKIKIHFSQHFRRIAYWQHWMSEPWSLSLNKSRNCLSNNRLRFLFAFEFTFQLFLCNNGGWEFFFIKYVLVVIC